MARLARVAVPVDEGQDRLRGVQWGLSDVGNWTDYQVDANDDAGSG